MGVKLDLGGFSLVLGGHFLFLQSQTKGNWHQQLGGVMNKTLSSEKNKDALCQCIYLKPLVETTSLMTVELTTACLQVFVGLIR